MEQSQNSSNSNQCFLEIKPGEDYQRCIWCINFRSLKDKEKHSFTPTKERSTPSSSETKWRCDFKDRRVGIRELCGDECLDFLIPVQTSFPNQVSYSVKRSNVAVRKLQGLSDAVKNDRRFHELQLKHQWLIDQENKEYFSDAYGITNINPLLVDNHGMTVLFLDNRGILFEWCELTRDMYVLGINDMEGLANFLYHPEKKLNIMEDTG
ncbi:6011_t:CDS:1 [Funneliformis caledonium]|uniref:6011_t:CDS:1 n=1 Tax=Funneliformis caledonium TaxID=1117310 RepID=A0A9N8VF29_9GLOM|nr:6011_t:CDS:1 [Funneliformis caledonium]